MKRFFGDRSGFRWQTDTAWRRDALRGGVVYCPQQGDDVLRVDCLACPMYGVWHDGDLELCKYEYEERKRNGLYAKDQEEWLEYLHDADPETWQRLIEEKRNQERVREEMEAESWIRHERSDDEAGDTEGETAPDKRESPASEIARGKGDRKREEHEDRPEMSKEDRNDEEEDEDDNDFENGEDYW